MDLDFTAQFGRPTGSRCEFCMAAQYKVKGSKDLICDNYHRLVKTRGRKKTATVILAKLGCLLRKLSSAKMKIAGKTFAPIVYASEANDQDDGGQIFIRRVDGDNKESLWVIYTYKIVFCGGLSDDRDNSVYWVGNGWSSSRTCYWKNNELYAEVENAISCMDRVYDGEYPRDSYKRRDEVRYVEPLIIKDFK